MNQSHVTYPRIKTCCLDEEGQPPVKVPKAAQLIYADHLGHTFWGELIINASYYGVFSFSAYWAVRKPCCLRQSLDLMEVPYRDGKRPIHEGLNMSLARFQQAVLSNDVKQAAIELHLIDRLQLQATIAGDV